MIFPVLYFFHVLPRGLAGAFNDNIHLGLNKEFGKDDKEIMEVRNYCRGEGYTAQQVVKQLAAFGPEEEYIEPPEKVRSNAPDKGDPIRISVTLLADTAQKH